MLNIEKYKDEIIHRIKEKGYVADAIYQIASQNGTRICSRISNESEAEIFKWLLQEYKEPVKLTQFEYDSLSFPSDNEYEFGNDLWCLHMKEKGYFKGVTDTSMEIKEIIERAEVVDGENH